MRKYFQSTLIFFFLIQCYMKSGKFKSCKYGEDNYKSNNLFSVPSPFKFSQEPKWVPILK